MNAARRISSETDASFYTAPEGRSNDADAFGADKNTQSTRVAIYRGNQFWSPAHTNKTEAGPSRNGLQPSESTTFPPNNSHKFTTLEALDEALAELALDDSPARRRSLGELSVNSSNSGHTISTLLGVHNNNHRHSPMRREFVQFVKNNEQRTDSDDVNYFDFWYGNLSSSAYTKSRPPS